MNKNKVYIWSGPGRGVLDGVLEDYTPGIAIAIAPSKAQAIEQLLEEYDRTIAAITKHHEIINSGKISKINRYDYSDFGTTDYSREEFARQLKKINQKCLNVMRILLFFKEVDHN